MPHNFPTHLGLGSDTVNEAAGTRLSISIPLRESLIQIHNFEVGFPCLSTSTSYIPTLISSNLIKGYMKLKTA